MRQLRGHRGATGPEGGGEAATVAEARRKAEAVALVAMLERGLSEDGPGRRVPETPERVVG